MTTSSENTPVTADDTLGWAISYATHQAVLNHIQVLEARIKLLRGTVTGIATNGTSCGACRLMNEIANEALRRDDAVAELKELPLMWDQQAHGMGLIEP